MTTAQEIKDELGDKKYKLDNPDLMQWKFVEKLMSHDLSDATPLSELSPEEILCIANHRALSKLLKAKEPTEDDNNGLIFMDEFFNQVIQLRAALGRKRCNEIVTILKRRPSYYGISNMGGMPADEDGEKKPFWKIW